jgi:hypothetical protein
MLELQFFIARGTLHSNDRKDTPTDTEGFKKYSIKIGSRAMICVSSFVKIIAGIQKLMRGTFTEHRQHGDLINQLSFSQKKES